MEALVWRQLIIDSRIRFLIVYYYILYSLPLDLLLL
jgi:hypothetical protein